MKEPTIPEPTTAPGAGPCGGPLLDAELAYAVLDRIAADPDSLDQSDWVTAVGDGRGCGTVACLAGWAVVLAGGTLLNGRQASLTIPDRTPLRYSDSHEVFDEHHISSAAMTALGLDAGQADDLFHAHNTIADLYRLVEQIYGPRPTRTPTPPTEAITRAWRTVDDPAVKLSILSALLADLIEDNDLYGRVSYGAEPGEKHRLTIEVEQDLIAARTSVDNTAYYIKVGDNLAAKGRR